MQEKISLPNPIHDDIMNNGPKFQQSIFETTEKIKNTGWGAKIKHWFNATSQIPLVILALVTLTVGSLVIVGNNEAQAPVSNTVTIQETLSVLDSTTNTQPAISGNSTENITVVASYGNGITHLARSATNTYLKTNGLNLNPEQILYAEDYLQNLTGSYGLEVGQEINFSTADIQEAINQATTLTDSQIQNLSKYLN